MNTSTIAQRADLTFKHNRDKGRHGWLRLTPAYSVKLTQELLMQRSGARILEPFAGTSTTALCAANLGRTAVAVDINPFLVWLGRAKVRSYSDAQLRDFALLREALRRKLERPFSPAAPAPPLHNIERWWGPRALNFLGRLKAQLTKLGSRAAPPVVDLFKVSFCRTLIAMSSAAFDHPSMSFSDAPPPQRSPAALVEQFCQDTLHVQESARLNPIGSAQIIQGDAQNLSHLQNLAPFDLVITSPPYPNRMSYIRELRPYMYWLDHLQEAAEASALDWKAIGGTWGKATSNLQSWEPKSAPQASLQKKLRAIEASHPKNGVLMARYVHKYFQDMQDHLQSIVPLVRPGGELHYIVGNTSFYGHLVPVEQLFIDMMRDAGLVRTKAAIIRKRNSKKELFEFHVQAMKP